MKFKRRKVKICITLDKGLVRAIDRVRGPLPRSSFIEMLIEEGLKAYGKLPHEVLSSPVEAIILNLEVLASTMPPMPTEDESLTEQIKRKRRELGLIV